MTNNKKSDRALRILAACFSITVILLFLLLVDSKLSHLKVNSLLEPIHAQAIEPPIRRYIVIDSEDDQLIGTIIELDSHSNY